MQKAKYVKVVTVIDPDSKLEVEVSIYKHENGGMFGIDGSFVDQVADGVLGTEDAVIVDPFYEIDDLKDGEPLYLILED